jgi:hypothetical protein
LQKFIALMMEASKTAQQPRRQPSSYSPTWEPQISLSYKSESEKLECKTFFRGRIPNTLPSTNTAETKTLQVKSSKTRHEAHSAMQEAYFLFKPKNTDDHVNNIF